MKYNKAEIKTLHSRGYSIRQIQKQLGISSPSVVQWHLKNVTRTELVERLNDLEVEITTLKRTLDANGIFL